MSVAEEIARRLAETRVPGSPNEFTAERIRNLAVRYLEDIDEELERDPSLAEQPHWNLWMSDARYEDALFVVLLFRPGWVELICGTGNAFAIREFAGRDFPDDIEQMPSELSRLFSCPTGSISLDREAAVGWLGRGW